MWESSRFRGKNQGKNGNGGPATGGGSRRGGGRNARPPRLRMKRVLGHFAVTASEGEAPAAIVPTRLILNDLGPASVTVFAGMPLELDQMVTFVLQHPRPLEVRGKVTYCALFELTSRVHSAPKFPYRIQVEFDFLNDGEAQAVREYVEALTEGDTTSRAA